MEILKYIAVGIAGYLLGSVSISILMSKKAMGGDVREKGSGNAGATNMARVYGWSAGFLTLGGDILKAAIAMLIGLLLLGDLGIAIGGIAAMIGHCFPGFYGFKGGNGVCILAAVACFMAWRVVVIGLAIFIIVALITKKVSPGSLAAAVSVPVISWLVGVSTPKLVLAIFAGIMVIIQHRANIKRLINGTESNFKAAKK